MATAFANKVAAGTVASRPAVVPKVCKLAVGTVSLWTKAPLAAAPAPGIGCTCRDG